MLSHNVFHGPKPLSTPGEFRHIQVESLGEVCVVRVLTENLGRQSAIDSACKELNQLAETQRKLLLDFTAVTLVSSMMLGRLIQLKEHLTKDSGKLVLCNLQRKVYQVFAVTRLTKTFDIKKDQAEGIAAF